MGILSEVERRASLEDPNTPLGDGATIATLFGGGGATATGKTINEQSALGLAPFWSGVQQIASSLGTLSVKTYERQPDGGKAEVRQHPTWELLRVQPNPEMQATPYREAKQGHLLLRGNTYSEIVTDGAGRVRELWPIPPQAVEIKRIGGALVYEVRIGDAKEILPFEKVLHVAGLGGDGVSGWSVVKMARESLALGLASEEYGARFFSNNARPSGILSHPESLSDTGAARLKKSWESAQGGLSNSHRVAVLEEGVQWQQIGLTAEDSQFLETRQFQVREIARWLNIPPHKIGDLDDATFSNIEEQSLEYVQDTLMPWIRRWENALNAKLLTPAERARGLFIEFDVKSQLRSDVEKRGQFYQTRFNTGSMTPNEIRAKENENPIDGGDQAFVQINMMPLSQAMSMTPEERMDMVLASQGVVPPSYEQRKQSAPERRSFAGRLRVREAFRRLLTDASERMVRGELRNVRNAKDRLIKEPARFVDWLVEYYFTDHPEFARDVLGPTFRSYAEAMSGEAADEIDMEDTPELRDFIDLYTETFIQRYSASSRTQLESLLNEDEPEAAIEQRLNEWEEGSSEEVLPRYRNVADRATTELGNAITAQVFSAAAIATMISRAIGDNCPYCRALDGRTVAIGSPIFQKGDTFDPEDADVPLTFKSKIKYPPYHKGCDCIVVPGE